MEGKEEWHQGERKQMQMDRHIKRLKKQFRKAKRRLELGVGKPDDKRLLEELAVKLNYKYDRSTTK